jgi:3-mercaptopyruvate sulfurtransferase SseA
MNINASRSRHMPDPSFDSRHSIRPVARARRGLVLAILAVPALLGCNTSTSDKDLVMVDVPTAQSLARGSKPVLGIGGSSAAYVDPRGATEYAAGHIPDALNMPFTAVQQEHKRLNGYGMIIVYGSDYGDDIAAAMAKRLIALGHDEVRILHGGLRAWEQAGNPVATGAAAAE